MYLVIFFDLQSTLSDISVAIFYLLSFGYNLLGVSCAANDTRSVGAEGDVAIVTVGGGGIPGSQMPSQFLQRPVSVAATCPRVSGRGLCCH